MPAHTILVDYENVQPALGGISEYESVKCLVFLGPLQKLPKDYAPTAAIECIRMDGRGRNALDFLIAYRLGQMAMQAPGSNYYIVSKDTGFDPLIRHIQTSGTKAQRVPSFDGIPLDLLSQAGPIPAPHAQALILRLGRMRFRPKSVKALRNCFASHFGLRPCGQTWVDASIQLLVEQRHIMINGGKVEYMSLSTGH